MIRTRTWLATIGVAGLMTLAVACGGDDNGGGGSGFNESQAKAATNNLMKTAFGLFTGDATAKQFIELFDPECREGVDEGEISTGLALIQAFAPELSKLDIEDFDVGDVKVEESGEGYRVTVANPDSMRVKVDGKFVDADEFFEDAGFGEITEGDPSEEPINFIRKDGKVYVTDCEALGDFS